MKEKIQKFIKAFQMNGEVKKRTIIYGVIALVVIVAIILLACLSPKKTDEVKPISKNPAADKETVEVEEIEEPEEMQEIFDKYPDVYAWLEIPGTAVYRGDYGDLSYPIAQHPTDREFYLDHDLDGNKYQPGVLFTEAEILDIKANSRDLNDPVTVIYGHNQRDCSMLGGLEGYCSTLDFTKDNVMYMYQEGRRVTYQLLGGVQYSNKHILYYNQFDDAGAFNQFFEDLWANTMPATHLDKDNMPVAGDRVLLLSVCKNGDTNHDYRYLIVGKVIEDTADTTVTEKTK